MFLTASSFFTTDACVQKRRENKVSKHVQHDYFSLFSQLNRWFVALSKPLSSSFLKLPISFVHSRSSLLAVLNLVGMTRITDRLLHQIGAEKGAAFKQNLFLWVILHILHSHNHAIPQVMPYAIPQTHSAFYPHRKRSPWLDFWILWNKHRVDSAKSSLHVRH